MSANKDEVLAQQDDCIKRCVDRIAELEAENASLKGDLESHLWAGDRVVDAEARAERAEAACAEVREALERVAANLRVFVSEHDDPGAEALACLHCADKALSTTCGERCARIVEAAKDVIADYEDGSLPPDDWEFQLSCSMSELRQALAAKEPSEEEKP